MGPAAVSCLDGAWRFTFAFDPNREAILLVGGIMGGIVENLFYRRLIRQEIEGLRALRRFVEAVGGSLEIRVELPGKGVVRLTGLGDLR